MENSKKNLRIIHFNDVYDISENPKSYMCGGVARFATLVKTLKNEHPSSLVLFSGDLWSPSKQTTLFKGEQIIGPINECMIDCASLGNHDLVTPIKPNILGPRP